MTNIMTRNRICEHLGKYVFDKIWNDPYSEYRSFTVTECLTKVATAGIFFGRYNQVQLPSSVPYKSTSRLYYYVYALPANQIRNLHLNVLEWTRLDTYCTDNLIDLEFFNEHGRRIIRNGIFICQAAKNDCILIAVEMSAFQKCFGADYDHMGRFYFGKYFDSDLETSVKYEDIVLASSDIPANQESGTKYDPITKSGTPTYTLYNGRLLTGDYMDVLATKAMVEKVYDTNIKGIIDIPCVGDDAPIYPGLDTKWRVLVHIPKSVNTNHVIITPNTCDIYLVPSEMEEGTGNYQTSGIYLYQCGRQDHFHQLTHNDFSIDQEWIKTLAATYGFKNYYLRVMIRVHSKAKTAIRDASYLNILYMHTDEEIINFLTDRSDYTIPFWLAKNLEDGLYQQILIARRNVVPSAADQCSTCANYSICDLHRTDTVCPQYSRMSIDNFIDAIGYYHTLALIGKHVHYFEVVNDTLGKKYKIVDGKKVEITEPSSTGLREFCVRAPLALVDLDYNDYIAVVYINGLRIDQKYISIKTGASLSNQYHKEIEFTPDADWWNKVIDVNYADHLRVCLDESVALSVGDRVVIEIYDHRHDYQYKLFTVPEAEYAVTTDTAFDINKTPGYFVLYDGKYVGIKFTKELKKLDGQPIGPEYEYDVGIKDAEGNIVKFSTFYDWSNPYQIQMKTENEWKINNILKHTDRNDVIYSIIEDPGTFDKTTKILTMDNRFAGVTLLLVEGPMVFENSGSRTITDTETGYLGSDIWTDPQTNFDNYPLDSEVTFMNGHRLVRGLDYTVEGYNGTGSAIPGSQLYLQNVSYLKKETAYQILRTSMTTLSQQRGFLRGKIIQWNHQNPFWFDELSVMTLGGTICTHLSHQLGTITLTDEDNHDNGIPYEFMMTVSTKIKNLVGTHGEDTDRERIETIKAYFDSKYKKPDFITIVKKAHKVYSTYMEQIISTYVTDPNFTFFSVGQQTTRAVGDLPAGTLVTKDNFEEQFSGFSDWKLRDLVYALSAEDLKYTDVYPLFNRLKTINRYEYNKITALVKLLEPGDKYKHKDAANVK